MEAVNCEDEYEHPVPGIMYVTDNIPGPGIDADDFELEFSSGCKCTGQCEDSCSCTQGSISYIDGKITDEKLTGPVLECHSKCNCDLDCGNRLIQKGPLNSLVVTKIDGKGLGLTTNKLIQKGQFICLYAGEVIGITEARRRVENNKKDNAMNYVLVIKEHISERTIVTCIDPAYFGNIGRYANHSCQPNTSLVPVRVENLVPRLGLFAIRDIVSGEEVTFDYAGGGAVAIDSVPSLSDTLCLCGSDNCKVYLPHDSI